jgi:hypothetical protein
MQVLASKAFSHFSGRRPSRPSSPLRGRLSAQHAGRRRPARAPRVPFAILVLALLVGALAALLALNTASAANELRRHDLAVKDTGLAAQSEQLQNQVAASAAPGNLASAAAQLGMVPAGNPAFLQIDADGKITLLGSPAAATGVVAPPAVAAPTGPATMAVSSKATSTKATSTKATSTTATPTTATPTTATPTRATPTRTPRTSAGATFRAAVRTPTPSATITLPGGTR